MNDGLVRLRRYRLPFFRVKDIEPRFNDGPLVSILGAV
jgi:hypothetical protein